MHLTPCWLTRRGQAVCQQAKLADARQLLDHLFPLLSRHYCAPAPAAAGQLQVQRQPGSQCPGAHHSLLGLPRRCSGIVTKCHFAPVEGGGQYPDAGRGDMTFSLLVLTLKQAEAMVIVRVADAFKDCASCLAGMRCRPQGVSSALPPMLVLPGVGCYCFAPSAERSGLTGTAFCAQVSCRLSCWCWVMFCKPACHAHPQQMLAGGLMHVSAVHIADRDPQAAYTLNLAVCMRLADCGPSGPAGKEGVQAFCSGSISGHLS